MKFDHTLPPRDPLHGLDNRYDVRDPSTWYLLHDYRRIIALPDGRVIKVKVQRGFPWDSASIPKFLQDRIAKWGRHSTASLVHDWLYHHRIGDRLTADQVFLQCLKEDGVGWLKRSAMYRAVRLFGGRAWRDDD